MKTDLFETLSSTPTIPNSVYENIPPYLKSLTDVFSDQREKDIILTSSLVVMGGVFSNIKGKYRREWTYPSLLGFIVAPPASGKGCMKHTKHLVKKIQDELTKSNKKNKEDYKIKLIQWEKNHSKSKINAVSQPEKPKFPHILIPGNSSSASLYSLLDNNDGVGIIIETEADSISSAINQQWGDFSNIFRAAFSHETISKSRTLNDEYIIVEKIRLSAMLSGTPDQVPRLIGTSANGLFSRFLFYCFCRDMKWVEEPQGSPEVAPEEFFKIQSELMFDVKKILDEKQYTFNISAKQIHKMAPIFQSKLNKLDLFELQEVQSVVFRLGLICFRLAMILTVLRNINDLPNHTTMECSDKDFDIALDLINVYYEHSMVIFSLLPKHTQSNTNPRIMQFYTLLPDKDKFTRKKADEKAASINISERSVNNYLNILTENRLLTKIANGIYEKVNKTSSQMAMWKDGNL